jgi:hypothetical protein
MGVPHHHLPEHPQSAPTRGAPYIETVARLTTGGVLAA